MSDEIYDSVLFDAAVHTPTAPMMNGGRCATFGGLSKVIARVVSCRLGFVYRRARERNRVPSGNRIAGVAAFVQQRARAMAVQTALGGYQSIADLTGEGGRLAESRRAVIESVNKSKFLKFVEPAGALYAFIQVSHPELKDFDDYDFAMDLLEKKHVLLAPGSSFNYPHKRQFQDYDFARGQRDL